MSEPASEIVVEAPIVAVASNEFRWKRYILVGILLVYGVMSIKDGFFKYPKANEEARRNHFDQLPYPGYDVQLNQDLGILLPPLGLALLAWSLYISRGAYRLENSTLSIPGHPAIPLESIQSVDRSKWERKGIAEVEYQLSGEQTQRFKLDDFIYQREPTDRIFAEIEKLFAPPKEEAPDVQSEAS